MSEKRFKKTRIVDKWGGIYDSQTDRILDVNDVEHKLNEQQDTIITLKRRLEKINGGYGHLTHRNGLTANEWLIESQERELQKKNEQISDWIERHSKDIAKICKQQATINKLKEENEQLKQKLENLDLKEENEQLREINKELGDDLYNCRLNKSIIREKLKLWQDVHKEYGIYSIKDFEESFELDAKNQ